MSTTMTIRLADEVKDRLDRLAESTQRSRSSLAAEAIRELVENNEWQVAEIKAALKEADAGDFASDKDAADDDPAAARLVAGRVLAAIDLLADQPALGRPGRVPGTRELVVPKTRCLVPYRVRRDTIEILRVFHTSRRLPQRW